MPVTSRDAAVGALPEQPGAEEAAAAAAAAEVSTAPPPGDVSLRFIDDSPHIVLPHSPLHQPAGVSLNSGTR